MGETYKETKRILAVTQKSFSVKIVNSFIGFQQPDRPVTVSVSSEKTSFLNNEAAADAAHDRNVLYSILMIYFHQSFLSQAWQEQLRKRAMHNFTKLNRPGQWKSGFWMKIRLRPQGFVVSPTTEAEPEPAAAHVAKPLEAEHRNFRCHLWRPFPEKQGNCQPEISSPEKHVLWRHINLYLCSLRSVTDSILDTSYVLSDK